MTRRQRSRRARAFLNERDSTRIRRASFAYEIDGSLEFEAMTYNCGHGPAERPTRLNPKWPRESSEPIIFGVGEAPFHT